MKSITHCSSRKGINMDKLIYGVAYYDEYMPYNRLEEDIKMMKDAGINMVRIAESTWSTHEPQNGVFDFSSVDRVLTAMHDAEIQVIIGTPTYAVPTWMVKEHPDVLAETPNGKGKYGARQIMDITNPTYLFYAERIIRKLINHVKDHPAVIGYQTDNETKHYETVGENVQTLFVKYMREKYHSLKHINKEFGLDYWSNRINSWEDFPSVVGTINGSLGSAFATFQRKLVTNFLKWQVGIVNQYKKNNQFVTQNFDFEWRNYSYGVQPDVNHFEASEIFDVTGVDIYHPSQDDLTGIEIAFGGDIARSTKQQNYFVLETQAQAFTHWTPYPGQLRLQAFSHLASGANMVAYWHWHSIHNSFETYWKGLLSHDFQPNPIYNEAKIIGKDFERLSEQLVDLKKKNDVAILISNEALTAIEWFPLNFSKNKNYNDIVRWLYDPLYKMNVECDFISPNCENIDQYKLIIVPSLYSASDKTLKALNQFTENGGHIIYTFKSGFANENVKVRTSEQPGIITESCGVTYNMFIEPNNVGIKEHEFDITDGSNQVKYWMELLTPTSANVLAYYEHNHWGEYAAITENKYGKGKAYYIGCYTSNQIITELLKYAVQEAGLYKEEQSLQYPIITRKGINKQNKKIRYVFNYSDHQRTITYPFQDGIELLTNGRINKKDTFIIKKWGVKIIEENVR